MGVHATLSKRCKSLITTAVTVAALGGVAAAATPASAAGGDDGAGTGVTLLATSLRGANEVPVPGGPAAGDKDGAALEFIKIDGDRVSVAVTWRGTGRPTRLHLHQGAKGTNGDVRIDFSGLLKHSRRHSVTGAVEVQDPALLDALRNDPGSFYANLHTAEFPGGAVRGSLHKVTVAAFDFRDALDNFRASVVRGRQIYECKATDAGGYAYAQRDVDALLEGGIHHTFVAPGSGTPQWVAPDGSAVTGAVLSRTPNGDGAIPELDLRATSSGRHHGLLAGTTEILRLNTVGGVAPSGACEPGSVVGVPYRADYVFLQG
ncbi:CHRD domain-containing protein [Streptomyces sp. NPDC001102]